MEEVRYKSIGQNVVNAIVALQDPRGSTAKDIKKYLVSTSQINKDVDIKPAILAALKSNKLSRPQGSRGRFIFSWNANKSKTEQAKATKSGVHHRASCGRRRRSRRRSRRRRSRWRSRRRCRRRRSRRRSRRRCRRSRRRYGRRRRRTCGRRKRRPGLILGDRRKVIKQISKMQVPSGKQLVVFCARRKRK